MPLSRTQLLARLDELGFRTTTIEHPPAFTVDDSVGFEGALPGAHTKNLFLKDDKGRLVLVVAKNTTAVDLKSLAKRLGLGRFSFARPDLLQSVLGVTPGSVTAFAIANDNAGRVTIVLDQALMSDESWNCHPLENTATTNVAREDLLRFIHLTGHEPHIMTLTACDLSAAARR